MNELAGFGFWGTYDPRGRGIALRAPENGGSLSLGPLAVCWGAGVLTARSSRGLVLIHGEVCPRDVDAATRLLADIEHGRNLPPPEGHYAALLYDHASRELTVLRDRAGVYRLYHRLLPGGRLAFSTRLEPLAELAQRPGLDVAAARNYLLLGYCLGPRTLLEGVSKVLPGDSLRARAGAVEVVPYWRPKLVADMDMDLRAQTRRYRELFEEAVAWSAGVSGALCGLTLSGGIDSSAIALTAARSGRRAQTYSYRFNDAPDGADESAEAAALATRLGLAHRVVSASAREHLDSLPGLLRASRLEEPVEFRSLPFLALHRAAAEDGCSVLLNGGGSESNGGRESVRRAHALAWLTRVVPSGLLPTPHRDPLHLHLNTVMGRPAPAPELMSSWAPLGRRPEIEDGLAQVETLLRESSNLAPFNRALYVRQRTWNSEHFLYIPHAAGLSTCPAGFPFMYPPLVAFMSRAPVSSKLTLFSDHCRKLLYRAFRHDLPRRVIGRRKAAGPWALWSWCRSAAPEPTRTWLERGAALLERHPGLGPRAWSHDDGTLGERLAQLGCWAQRWLP